MKPLLRTVGLTVFLSTLSLQAQESVAPFAFGSAPELDLSVVYERQERFLKRRIKLNPANSGLDRAALAGVYLGQSELQSDVLLIDRAEEEATRSLKQLSFYNLGAKLVLAKATEERHEFASATQQAKAILIESPGEVAALSILVSSNLGFGKLTEALTSADELVRLKPETNSYTLRALVRLAQGEEALALEDFSLAFKAEKGGDRRGSTFLRTVIGRHYYHKGDLASADGYLDSALLITQEDDLVLSLKSQVARARGNLQDAKSFILRAVKTRSEPLYLVTLSDIYRREGQAAAAKKTLEEAEVAVRSEIAETRYDHFNELTEILLLRNLPQEKAETLDAAAANVTQRQNAESYYLLARAQLNAGNPTEADAAISQALETKALDCRYGLLKQKIKERSSRISAPNCPQAELDLNTYLSI